jgi:NhaP-type Na+/H+ or K+/H+ antiporter
MRQAMLVGAVLAAISPTYAEAVAKRLKREQYYRRM